MNRRQRKAKKIGVVAVGLGGLTCFFASCISGAQEQWFKFGLYLAGCVVMAVFFTGIVLQLDIDARFNQLEKLIESKGNKGTGEQKE